MKQIELFNTVIVKNFRDSVTIIDFEYYANC